MEKNLEIVLQARAEYKEGSELYFGAESDEVSKARGFELIKSAAMKRHPAAMYTYGVLLVSGREEADKTDRIDRGLGYVWQSERAGVKNARKMMDDYCTARYKAFFARQLNVIPPMPLVGFDGKAIKLKKVSKLTPIDIWLDYVNGENILNIGANLDFVETETQLPDEVGFYEAVIRGIKDWEGEYVVFGGQKLKVRINISTEDRLFDKIFIVPMTKDLNDATQKMAGIFGDKKKARIDSMINSRRSMAGIGIRKWSVRSRKIIMVQSSTGRFNDLEYIRCVARHEFGHVLGLGDLYQSRSDGYPGVAKGTFKELDAYYVNNKFYNLVMCDERGIISNNDIEMVILAFLNNEMQNYQPTHLGKTISKALGKGN